MKGKKCFIGLVALFISLLVGVGINIKNTSAIVPLIDRNILSLGYYINSTSGTEIVANSINNNTMSPRIQLTTASGQASTILRTRFHLNNTVTLSPKKHFRLKLKVTIETSTVYTNTLPNVSFICPRGDYEQKLYVSGCEIDAYNKVIQSYETAYTSNGQIFDITSDYQEDDIYITIDLYSSEEEGRAYQDIQLIGRMFSVYNGGTTGNLISILQFTYLQSMSYQEEKTAMDEMNERDEQDRDNLETQQSETEGEAEDQEDEATQTGSSLFAAFGSLITALTNAHTTNCKLPNTSVYTIQLRNLDLCQVDLPNGVSTLTGIAMSFLIIKMGISLVHRMLNLYKEIIG